MHKSRKILVENINRYEWMVVKCNEIENGLKEKIREKFIIFWKARHLHCEFHLKFSLFSQMDIALREKILL